MVAWPTVAQRRQPEADTPMVVKNWLPATRKRGRTSALVAVLVSSSVLLSACSATNQSASETPGAEVVADSANGSEASVEHLRLGFFPNVTHAAAVVGINEGIFADNLHGVALDPIAFNAGPSAIEALNAGAIDCSFIGPNPAINGFVRSGGQALRIVAGAASGGAQFLVREGINTVEDLRGTVIASPQLGNTQDVAVRWYLSDHGLSFATGGGADVSVTPTDNPQSLLLFSQGQIDGAWVPEPWASRLVLEEGAHVFLDERDEWPDGQFVTAHLICRTDFLEQHPDAVESLIRGLVAAQDFIANDPEGAKHAFQIGMEEAVGSAPSDEVLNRSFEFTDFTYDPVASSLQAGLDHAVAVEVSDPGDLNGIYDLRILNRVLTEAGRPTVSAAGLGEE